jgi:hypothetical protein
MKFTVETSPSGQAAFSTDDSRSVRIQLTQPADFQHAWRVANFLAENVQRVAVAGHGLDVTSLGDAYAGR